MNTLKKNLIENGVQVPKVCDVQNDFPIKGGWTFFPIFPALYDQVKCVIKRLTCLLTNNHQNVKIHFFFPLFDYFMNSIWKPKHFLGKCYD